MMRYGCYMKRLRYPTLKHACKKQHELAKRSTYLYDYGEDASEVSSSLSETSSGNSTPKISGSFSQTDFLS